MPGSSEHDHQSRRQERPRHPSDAGAAGRPAADLDATALTETASRVEVLWEGGPPRRSTHCPELPEDAE